HPPRQPGPHPPRQPHPPPCQPPCQPPRHADAGVGVNVATPRALTATMTSANLRNIAASPVGSDFSSQSEDLPPETVVLVAAPIALASGPMWRRCWLRYCSEGCGAQRLLTYVRSQEWHSGKTGEFA